MPIMNTEYAVGKCNTMCPVDEMMMRQRENLLHVFEMVPGTERNRNPSVDKERAVKMYNRSAAGKFMTNENYLRPPDVLLKTVTYLLQNVVEDSRYSWLTKYDFIADRLRSVRQDMIIQNISRVHAISLLQPMVRFYTYSSYRLCEEHIHNFDPHLNKKTLQECLNNLLRLYDQLEELASSSNYDTHMFEQMNESRPFFEALNIILNLGNEEPLLRILNLPKRWRTPIVETSTMVAINYMRKNFVKLCKHVNDFSPLLSGVFVLHLPEIRRETLQMMSVAYSSKNLRFPMADLKKLLLYESEDDLLNDCKCFAIDTKEGFVHFDKNSFKLDMQKVPPRKMISLNERFKKFNESSMLMFGDDSTVQLSVGMKNINI